MWNTFRNATKSVAAVTAVAVLVGASSSVGAFANTGESSTSGESSAVGSAGYASAYVTYANASVSGPTSSSQPVTATASSPYTAAAVASGSSASATTSPSAPAPAAPSAADAPKVVVQKTASSSASLADTVKIVEPASTTSDALQDAIDKIEELGGLDLPDLPVDLPPVEGTAVKAAVLLLLTTIQTEMTATVTAAEAATLAAIEYARAQTVLAFQDLNMPEVEAAVLAKIDDARDQAVAAYATATTAMTAAFAQANAAVLAKDPAELDDLPGEVIPFITATQLAIVQKLTQAQTALAGVLTQFS